MSDAVPCRCHSVRLAEHGQEYDGGQFDATGREFTSVYANTGKIKDDNVFPEESRGYC